MNFSRSNQIVSKASFCAALVIGVALSGQVNAASACKGLDVSGCGAENTCSWVNSYERKDGRSVKGFCRTKAKRAAVSTKTSTKVNKSPKVASTPSS